MTRDPQAEDRLRAELAGAGLTGADGLSERPMFGGLCLMRHGHMLAGVREGRLMLRVGPEAEADALTLPAVTPMIHGGRRMRGYVFLDTAAASDDTRATLLAMALSHVGTLPPKGCGAARPTRSQQTRSSRTQAP